MVNAFEFQMAEAECRLANAAKVLVETERRLTVCEAYESKDLLDLAKLVLRMRDAQRESRRTMRFNAGEAMGRHEKEVDKALSEILNDVGKPLLG